MAEKVHRAFIKNSRSSTLPGYSLYLKGICRASVYERYPQNLRIGPLKNRFFRLYSRKMHKLDANLRFWTSESEHKAL